MGRGKLVSGTCVAFGAADPLRFPSRWPRRSRRSLRLLAPGCANTGREARLSREGRRRASPWRSQTGSSFSPDVLADGSPLRWREKRQLCLLAHAGGGDGGQDARRWKGSRVEPAAQPPPKCISSTRPPGPRRCLCRQLYCC